MSKEEMIVKLIETGARAMAAKGYHGVGLQEVLNEAGVPKGSFYYYFKSKEQFAVAIIDYYIERKIQGNLSLLIDKTSSPRDRFRNFFAAERTRYLSGECCQDGCRLVVKLANEVNELSPTMRNAVMNGIGRWIKVIEGCLEEGLHTGDFHLDGSAEDMAEYIYSAWSGAVMRIRLTESMRSYDLFVEYLHSLILK